VEDFETKAGLQATIPWPDSEVAMLTVQAADDNHQPVDSVIEHLRQGRRVADTTPTRQNVLLEFILPATTLGNAGALHLFVRNDSYKRRQLIAVPTIGVAHVGKSRTFKTLHLRYWWCGMSQDVRSHVRNCRRCLLRKVNQNRTSHIPFQLYPTTRTPFEWVHMNLIVRLPVTTNKSSYTWSSSVVCQYNSSSWHPSGLRRPKTLPKPSTRIFIQESLFSTWRRPTSNNRPWR
jgi:hypothetical protein